MTAAYGNVPFFVWDGRPETMDRAKTKMFYLSDKKNVDLQSLNNLNDFEWKILLDHIDREGFTMKELLSKPYVRRYLGAVFFLELEKFITLWHDRMKSRKKSQKKLI